MTSPISSTPLPPPAAAEKSTRDQLGEAATMLEAYFLRRVMAEVRSTGEGGLLAPGFGGQMFREMLDEALADRMAEGGGVGIAEMVKRQLGGEMDGESAPPLRPAPTASAVRSAYGAGAPGAAAWRAPLGEATSLEPGKEWIMPVETTRISSGFGKIRPDPNNPGHTRTHKGIDMIAQPGTPVHAAGSGVVVRAEPTTGGFGNLVVIDHGGGTHTYYAHLQTIDVREGDRVETGALIGGVGSTGRSSAPHLHFEVRQDGRPIDPTDDVQDLKIGRTRTNR